MILVTIFVDDRRLPNVPGSQGANGSQTSSERTRHESVTSTTTGKSEGNVIFLILFHECLTILNFIYIP